MKEPIQIFVLSFEIAKTRDCPRFEVNLFKLLKIPGKIVIRFVRLIEAIMIPLLATAIKTNLLSLVIATSYQNQITIILANMSQIFQLGHSV